MLRRKEISAHRVCCCPASLPHLPPLSLLLCPEPATGHRSTTGKSRTLPGTFFSAPSHLAALHLLLASSYPSSRSRLKLSLPVGVYLTADTSSAQPPALWHSLALVITHHPVLGYNIHNPCGGVGGEGSRLPPFPSLQRRFPFSFC